MNSELYIILKGTLHFYHIITIAAIIGSILNYLKLLL